MPDRPSRPAPVVDRVEGLRRRSDTWNEAAKGLPLALAKGALPPLRTLAAIADQFAPRRAGPTATSLVEDWAIDRPGSRRYDIGPDTDFARKFAQAPSTRSNVRRAMADWGARDGNALIGRYGRHEGIEDGSVYGHFGSKFGPSEFVSDLLGANAPAHIMGSNTLSARRVGDRIEWKATNKMGRHSAGAGRYTDMIGLPGFADVTTGPGADRWHVVSFYTDLNGQPL
jgi:hypothetical protein